MKSAAVGDTLPPREVGPVTITDIVRFAGAGGDFNPLHHDPSVGEAAGFGGIIAMGQYQAALLAGTLSDWAGVENVLSLRVRFVSPVRAGDVVRIEGRVAKCEGDTALVELQAIVGEQIVVAGAARIRVDGSTDTEESR